MPYFAGNHRGSAHRCLRFYQVDVREDPRVGTPPRGVAFEMAEFGEVVRECFSTLDHAHKIPDRDLPRERKLYYTATVACRLLVAFLTTHPFADGNGHLARAIVVAVMGRYGYWLQKWSFEPNPDPRNQPDPARQMPYYKMIRTWRGWPPGKGDPDYDTCPVCLMNDLDDAA